MAMGGGTVAVLGTSLVAVLAVAAAVGADALVSHTTVEAGSSVSTSPATSSMSDDFCTLMGDLNTYYAAKSVENDVFSSTIDLSAGEDPAVLDAIHEQADATLELTAEMAAYLNHGAGLVSDATVAEALGTTAGYVRDQGEYVAQIYRDATSVEGFVTAMFGAAFDPAAQQAASDAEAGIGTITDYVTTECAIDISGVFGGESSGDSGDDADSVSGAASVNGAESDASTLGMEIKVAFVDWIEGDPLPTVELSDGMYGVTATSTSADGTSFSSSVFSAASSEPAIIDQAINGPTDWCVSVTDNAVAPPTTHRYSATGGLEEGTCAALADA